MLEQYHKERKGCNIEATHTPDFCRLLASSTVLYVLRCIIGRDCDFQAPVDPDPGPAFCEMLATDLRPSALLLDDIWRVHDIAIVRAGVEEDEVAASEVERRRALKLRHAPEIGVALNILRPIVCL